MSGWMVAALVAYLVLAVAVLLIAWGAIAQLVRLQAAIVAHHTFNDGPVRESDLVLYRKAGLVPELIRAPARLADVDSSFIRGSRFVDDFAQVPGSWSMR